MHVCVWQRLNTESWEEISIKLKGGCIISVINNDILVKVIPQLPAFMGSMACSQSRDEISHASLRLLQLSLLHSCSSFLQDFPFCVFRAGCLQTCSPDNIMQLFWPLLIFGLAALPGGVTSHFTSSAYFCPTALEANTA